MGKTLAARVLCIASACVLQFLSLQAAPGHAAPDSLQLTATLDRTDFLPGEPILVGITVRNAGEEPFVDLASLDPRVSKLAFEVYRDGRRVEWAGMQYTWVTMGDGLTLPPGDQLCDVFDLLTHFGSRGTVTTWAGSTPMSRVLKPGTYTVRPIFRARGRPGRPQVVVQGEALRFVVRDEASIPTGEQRALDLIRAARATVGGPPLMTTWKGFDREGLTSSRYFSLLAPLAWPRGDDSTSIEEVAEEQFKQGRGLLGAAWLLKVKYQAFAEDFDSCEAWLRRAESRSDTFACYLHTWVEYVKDRRKWATLDGSR